MYKPRATMSRLHRYRPPDRHNGPQEAAMTNANWNKSGTAEHLPTGDNKPEVEHVSGFRNETM